MLRTLGLALTGLLLASPSLSAQLAPYGVPKGTLRIDVGGAFESADRRLRDGHGEGYLADFGSPALGSDRIPLLRPTDSVLASILEQPGYRLNLGPTRPDGQLTVGTGTIGAALGVTRRLTLFARVPILTTRVQARLGLDSAGGDAGLNPAHPTLGSGLDQIRAAQFFGEFNTALADLNARIANGDYAGNPSLDSLARAIAARGADMRDGLALITTDPSAASPFLPTTGSASGQALVGRVRGLQDTLVNQLGVAGFATDPVLAGPRLSGEDFSAVLSNLAGPFAAFPLREAKLSRIGDMDVGAIYTLVDRFDRPGTTGGFRFAVEGLLRLPTGQTDNANNYLDVGTGYSRYEVGVTGVADVGSGPWGSRLSGGYLVRLPSLRVRRVSGPDEPYAEAGRLTNVELDAGDVLQLSARPFFRLERNLAITGAVEYWREGASEATYQRLQDSVPGIPASVLTRSSARSALALGGGISYVGRAVRECEPGRRCGFPIEANWTHTAVKWASGGRVVQSWVTRIEVRWYQRLWR